MPPAARHPGSRTTPAASDHPATAAPTVLFWDVDGTLLTTARAGMFAMEAAAREVLGVEADIAGLQTAGLTDAEVAAAVIGHCGREADAATVAAFLAVYERELPECLPRRRGNVMPGVVEILEDLAGRPDVVSLLLTGNTPTGARAKLRHYGLDAHFDGGAFCTGPGTREEIARAARDIVGAAAHTYVIGDTPLDIRCGKAIGARTVALATGAYSLEDLRSHDPWAALERLPEPPAFRALIGLDGHPPPARGYVLHE
jgi:phosphoglycolate phosphatase-like HAD superfamily hydrolase